MKTRCKTEPYPMTDQYVTDKLRKEYLWSMVVDGEFRAKDKESHMIIPPALGVE